MRDDHVSLACERDSRVVGAPIERNLHCHIPGPFPTQRIEDHHRDRLFARLLGVYPVDHRAECICIDLIRRPPHHVVILLRILIDHADPGPRRQIVELIKQHLLPILRQLRARILQTIKPGKRGKFLRIQYLDFALAHIPLVVGLRSHHSAVILKVKLALPRRNPHHPGIRRSRRRRIPLRNRLVIPHRTLRRNLLFDRRKPRLRSAELHIRSDLRRNRRHRPMKTLIQHRPRRPAAMIADPVEVHHVRHARGPRARHNQVGAQPHRAQVFIAIVVRKIRQHLRPIRRLPPEQFERQLIRVVPHHLLRNKIVHAALLVDLRQLPRIPKRIRIPADPHIHAIRLLVPPLAHQQLPHQALAVGHVQIRLNPHAAHHLPAPFLDALRNLRIHLGILLRQPLVVLRGRLRIGVLRILIHQLQRGPEGPLDHIHRLRPRPQPRGIDVRVAREMERGPLQQRFQYL